MNQGPVLGTTLFSLTNEWQQRLLTLEQMVEQVAARGLGPAVEVVGFQSFREFPDISDAFAEHFRELLARHGLVPGCLGANLDLGRRRGRPMTTDESVAYLERQIITAKKLGFPVMRIQLFAGPAVLEKVAASAEKAEVYLGCELHAPLTVDHPEVVHTREFYERLGSPFLGFIPDFSCTMTAVPAGFWASLRREGAPEGLIEAANAIWHSDKSIPEKFGALAAASARHGASPTVAGQLNRVMTMFGRMDVERWTEILPYARHIHGKFYHVDEAGNEPSIPYPAILALLKRVGYTGTISAEWEGQAFTEEPVGLREVQAWHAMCSRLLS